MKICQNIRFGRPTAKRAIKFTSRRKKLDPLLKSTAKFKESDVLMKSKQHQQLFLSFFLLFFLFFFLANYILNKTKSKALNWGLDKIQLWGRKVRKKKRTTQRADRDQDEKGEEKQKTICQEIHISLIMHFYKQIGFFYAYKIYCYLFCVHWKETRRNEWSRGRRSRGERT